MGSVFRRDYGVNIIPVAFLEKDLAADGSGFDFRDENDAKSALDMVTGLESFAGLAFIIDDALEQSIGGPEEVPLILKGFFSLLKAFVESPAKKFAILVDKCESPTAVGRSSRKACWRCS